MKRFFTIIATLVLATTIASAAPLSKRMNRYVEDTIEKCENWSKADWDKSKREYKLFIEEYKLYKDSYTQEERDAINKEIGRYNGLLVKHGIEELGDFLQGIGERIPSLWEGFKSVIKDSTKQ